MTTEQKSTIMTEVGKELVAERHGVSPKGFALEFVEHQSADRARQLRVSRPPHGSHPNS